MMRDLELSLVECAFGCLEHTIFDLVTALCTGLSKILGNLVVKYVPTYTKGI